MLQYCTSANKASTSNVGLQADCRGWRGGGAFVLQKCSLARQYYACGYPKVAVVGLERAWGSTKSSTYCSLSVTVKNDILRLASLIVPNWAVLCILSQSPSTLCLLEFFALGFSAEGIFLAGRARFSQFDCVRPSQRLTSRLIRFWGKGDCSTGQ